MTMDALNILNLCRENGVIVTLKGKKLKIVAKNKKIPVEIEKILREHKKNVVAFLSNINLTNINDNKHNVKIERARSLAVLPLSYGQQRLWFLSQYMGPSAVYNIPLALRLRGEVNESALVQSLKEIVCRHEALRTRFVKHEESAVQIIDPPTLGLQVEPVSLEAELQSICRHERGYPFDLSKDKLCRIRLLHDVSDKSAEYNDSYVLLVTMHHSVSDGWSLGVFVRELVALYQAFKNGEVSPLAPLEIQYADFAHWQRQWLHGEVLEHQLSYWQKQLSGLPPLLSLPYDRPRPAEQSFRGQIESISLPKVLLDRLLSLCQQQGVTLFMSLLSAFAILLSRYSGQDNIAIGTPIANRTRREMEDLIGFFVNTLVMRSDLSGDPSSVDLLKQIREVALQGYAHQDIPFEQLVEALSPERSLSYSSLFQVMFILQNVTLDTVSVPGFELTPLTFAQGGETDISHFDLTLALQETPQGIVGGMEYNTDLFDRDTIVRLLDHYERLLKAIVDAPDIRVSTIGLLSEVEQQQQLVEWNGTQADYPGGHCIHELFEAQVEKNPEAIALVSEQQQLSYGELNRRANQLAHYLIAEGVGPEVRVGICVERSIDMVVGILGILKAGGAYVPIDPGYPTERINYQLADSGVTLLLSQVDIAAQFSALQQQLLLLDKSASRAMLARQASTNIRCESIGLSPVNLSYLIYTSGSTGQPKGVMGLHRSIVNRVHWLQSTIGIAADDVLCQKTSLGFVDHVAEVFQALSTGVPLVIVATESVQTPALLLETLNAWQISQLTLVPSLLKVLLDSKAAVAVPRLRVMYSSGEALNLHHMENFFRCFPHSRLLNIYGSTEVGADASACELSDQQGVAVEQRAPLIGRAIANAQAYVLDSQGKLLPLGVVGELYIGGAVLARGYFHRASLTAEKFVPHPFSSTAGERLYRTGDLVRYVADGNLEYVERCDHQVKIRGLRIELGEIENVLLQHEQIKDVVVLARKDELDNTSLVAYVVGEPDADMLNNVSKNNELRAYAQTQLPAYMIPAAILVLAALPLTASGKVDRGALPAADISAQQVEYVAPVGVTEEILAGLWGDLLKHDRVSRFDNFFALGGHSILVMHLLEQIEIHCQVRLRVVDIFLHATILDLAEQIEKIQYLKNNDVIDSLTEEEAQRLLRELEVS